MEYQLDKWWAHQDSNLEPDRYEQRASTRNARRLANSASFATHLTQSVLAVFSKSGSVNQSAVRLFASVLDRR